MLHQLALVVVLFAAGTRAYTLGSSTLRLAGSRPRASHLNGQSEEDARAELKSKSEGSGASRLDISAPSSSDGSYNLDKELLTRLKSKRPYLSILTERLMQSVDDYQQASRIKKSGIEFGSNKSKREKIVVLGTGWGGHAFLKTIDASKYEVVTISPRNYFMFTPMLAASAVGTVEFRSICEPIRNVNRLADYLEATATAVNPDKKTVTCESVKCEGSSCEITEFEVNYDHLIIGVGATTNTFGIKGVKEHCLFLKQIEDANNLRKALAYCFERANIPTNTEEERKNSLAFVVVGAGPTGVEFTSELRDWIESEGKKYYKHLLKDVTLTLVEAGPSVLAVFDKALQEEAIRSLTDRKSALITEGIISEEMTRILTSSGVSEVAEKVIKLGDGTTLPYGFCVWAAGNGPIPFVSDLIEGIGEQKSAQDQARGRVVVDSWCRMHGAGSVYAIGDCTFNPENPLPATAQVASQQGSYLGRVFSKGYDMSAPVNVPPSRRVLVTVGGGEEEAGSRGDLSQVSPSRAMSEKLGVGQLGVKADIETWAEYIDKEAGATSSAKSTVLTPEAMHKRNLEYAKPFQFLNLGVLAYIGASRALAQVSVDEKLILGSGPIGFLLWRGIYWSKQVSWRNRVLVALDWIKASLFGRDIGNL